MDPMKVIHDESFCWRAGGVWVPNEDVAEDVHECGHEQSVVEADTGASTRDDNSSSYGQYGVFTSVEKTQSIQLTFKKSKLNHG